MTPRHGAVSDALLEQALRQRAGMADDAYLVDEVVAKVGSLPQRRAFWWADATPGRPWLVWVTALLLLAALVATISVGAALLLPNDPRPVPLAANGPVVVVHNGLLTAFTADGEQVRAAELALPTVFRVTDLSWSPDGARLAYVTGGSVFIADTRTGEARELTTCGGRAEHSCTLAWSPDGGAIAVADGELLSSVEPETGSRQIILQEPSVVDLSFPTWSPTGARIAYVARSGASQSLRVTARDGSNTELLYRPPPGDTIGIFDPAWSPDGSSIAFIASDSWGNEERWTLNVTMFDMNERSAHVVAEVGECYCLGFAPGLAWAPDATSLAVVVPGDTGDYGLHVLTLDGSVFRMVGPGSEGTPAWQPLPAGDGR